ncbi:MAG: hypothetical protein M0C28_25670 [Candidatus Moduliflexus flocculans]|nr:hypothetical protein [Candidatus Moduliflexus flocculans]
MRVSGGLLLHHGDLLDVRGAHGGGPGLPGRDGAAGRHRAAWRPWARPLKEGLEAAGREAGFGARVSGPAGHPLPHLRRGPGPLPEPALRRGHGAAGASSSTPTTTGSCPWPTRRRTSPPPSRPPGRSSWR